MSHKSAKATRRHVRGAKRLIVNDLMKQLMELPRWERCKFAWRLFDQSPKFGFSFSPLYAYLEQTGIWGVVVQFKSVWWSLDRAPKDASVRGRTGWSLTVLGVRLDWRKEGLT